MRALRMSALIGLLVLTACQADRQAPEPTGPTERIGASLNSSTSACPGAAKLLVQIVAIVKPGQGRLATAIIKFDQIVLALVRRDVPKAQQRMFELLDFLIQEYNNGNLIGGKSTATQTKLTTLTSGLYCFVGLPAPVIPAGALSADGAIGVVNNTSPTTTLVNSTNLAGVQIPSNAASTSVLVTISRIPNSPPPLLTPLDQYPAFYEYHASPDGAFASDVIIGVCVGDGASPTVFPRLKIAHNVGTGVEILDKVTLPFALDCSTLGLGMGAGEQGLFGLALRGLGTFKDLLLPQIAQAATVGTCCVGGSTKKFSPFGAVDTLMFVNAVSPTTVVGLLNSAIPANVLPSVRVTTLLGQPVPGLPVTFSIPVGIEGSITGAAQTTNSNGVATVGSWTLGGSLNSDTVVAVVTPFAGTGVSGNRVAFLGQPVSSTPVPYHSGDYFYKLIGSGSPPAGWEGEGFPSGFTSGGTAPFGSAFHTGGCPINGTVATTWPVGSTSVNSDVLVRHVFGVPNGWTGGLTIEVAIDNDIQVFMNGNDITASAGQALVGGFVTHEGCATQGSAVFTAPDAFLHAGGNNFLAVRARDRGGESFVDIKVTLGTP